MTNAEPHPQPQSREHGGPSVSELRRIISLSKELSDYVALRREPLLLSREFALGTHLMLLSTRVFVTAWPAEPLKCLETESADGLASILWKAHQALFEDYRTLGLGRIDMRIDGQGPFSGNVQDPFAFRGLMWPVVASCAVTLPPTEAGERVIRHALTRNLYEVAWLQMAARRMELGEDGEIVRAAVVLSLTKLPQAEYEGALKLLQRWAGINWTSMEQRIKDAKAEFNLALAELSAPLRGKSLEKLTALLIEGNKNLRYFPHAAACDVRNLVRTEEEEAVGDMDNLFRPDDESSEPAERDIASRFTRELRKEHFRRAANDQSWQDLTLQVKWLANLPPEYLAKLTPTECKIQREFAKAHRGETAPLASERDLASRAACSPAAVTKFLAKIRTLEEP